MVARILSDLNRSSEIYRVQIKSKMKHLVDDSNQVLLVSLKKGRN